MTVTVGHTAFDHLHYDADADVLYMHLGDPATAVGFDESPEGHALRFDDDGNRVGITRSTSSEMLDASETLAISIPERFTIDPGDLAPAVQSAA